MLYIQYKQTFSKKIFILYSKNTIFISQLRLSTNIILSCLQRNYKYYDENGGIAKSYTYDAFGVEKNIDETDANPFRYCGEYFDAETGTIYLRARYYNPTTGRFISRDSFAGRNSDPLSLNRYTYCRNNSIIFIDPSGYSYGTLPDGTKFSINSASDAKKFAELKSGKASSSQVQTTTAITTQVSTITGGLAVPATNTTTYTTTAKYDSGPFSSADNAALAFAKSTYSSSLYIRHEYSAIIYSKKSNNQKSFYYTVPNIGTPHSAIVNIKNIPKKATAVAYVHTHPNSTDFSDNDREAANKLKIDGYMADPNYDLHKYSSIDKSETIIDSFVPRELGEYEMIALEGTYGPSWWNHIVDGVCSEGFDCGNMQWPTP